MGQHIDAALERGREASRGRFVPVGVRWNGGLIADVRDEQNDRVESVHWHVGALTFCQVGVAGHDAKGNPEYRVHLVRARELKDVVKAMIGRSHRTFDADLLREAHAAWKRDRRSASQEPKRAKRGKS